MPGTSPLLEFLRDPDQESRRAELRDFCGPNADGFLKVYDTMYADALSAANGKKKFRFGGGGFVPAAFFCGPVWFFYRKMWVWAWGLTVVLIVIGLIPGLNRINFPVGIGLAIGGRRLYVTYAITKLQQMRAATGSLQPQDIRREGGVSVTAAWISGGIYAVLLLFALVGLVLLARSGAPLPR